MRGLFAKQTNASIDMNGKIDKEALRERKLERNEKVRFDYKALKAKKTRKGATVHSEDYILEKLAEKYFIARKTVQNILNYHYEKALQNPPKPKSTVDPNQLSLLDQIPDEEIPPVPTS